MDVQTSGGDTNTHEIQRRPAMGPRSDGPRNNATDLRAEGVTIIERHKQLKDWKELSWRSELMLGPVRQSTP
jgi:hypothetical protein